MLPWKRRSRRSSGRPKWAHHQRHQPQPSQVHNHHPSMIQPCDVTPPAVPSETGTLPDTLAATAAFSDTHTHAHTHTLNFLTRVNMAVSCQRSVCGLCLCLCLYLCLKAVSVCLSRTTSRSRTWKQYKDQLAIGREMMTALGEIAIRNPGNQPSKTATWNDSRQDAMRCD